MRIFNDEIEITRGEDITYDIEVLNFDGFPYIVSNAPPNPHWLITISTGKYYEHGRTVYNYWLPIKRIIADIPVAFYLTKPVKIDVSIISENIGPYTNADENLKEELLRLKRNGKITDNLDDYAVYYVEQDEYCRFYYWNGTEYKEYKNNVIVNFTSVDTLEWAEQDCELSLKLVAGPLNKISRSNEQPLKTFSYMEKIISPSKIIVYSNVDGSMEVKYESKKYNTSSGRG